MKPMVEPILDLSHLNDVLSAQEILDEAAREGYEEVVVVGLKAGRCFLAKSSGQSCALTVGLLFTAAQRISNSGWDGDE